MMFGHPLLVKNEKYSVKHLFEFIIVFDELVWLVSEFSFVLQITM